MNVRVNGENMNFQSPLSVRELIVHLGLTDGPVAVERNLEVVPRAEHETTSLCDGDTVEIVHFVGGG